MSTPHTLKHAPKIRGNSKEQPKERRKEETRTPHPTPTPQHRRNTPYEGTLAPPPNRLYSSPGLEKVIDQRVQPNNRRLADYYRWLVSTILFVGAMNKEHAGDKGAYVPLKYQVLRSVMPKKRLTGIIRDLIAWQLIERRESYRKDYYSKGYRLNPEFMFGKFRIRIIGDPLLNKKINAHRERLRNQVLRRPGYEAVYRSVEALEIDHRRARRLVLKQFKAKVLRDTRRYTSRMVSIDSIALNNLFYAIDPKTGRFYHSYACLAKELRPMVRLEGRPLREVDITNSQPLLLHLMLKDRGMVHPTEAERMEKLVLGGLFYEEFNTEGADRDVFKKEFFRDVLFGKGMYSNATTDLFTRKFPSYAAAIRKLKQGDHTRVAIAMQTMEAQIIFAAVERFIRRFGRHAPIITIHDSLSTIPDYSEAAMEVLYEEFEERFGVRPHLKMK